MKVKHLVVVLGFVALAIAGGLAGLYYALVAQMSGGPRTTPPAVLIPEYNGPIPGGRPVPPDELPPAAAPPGAEAP